MNARATDFKILLQRRGGGGCAGDLFSFQLHKITNNVFLCVMTNFPFEVFDRQRRCDARLIALKDYTWTPQLMEHLEQPYYVALLSAAAYHSAAHQAPMVFQVMVPRSRRSFECGGVRVDFVARRDMESTFVGERDTPTGVLRIASPGGTTIELLGYPERCGFLDNVATVLAELAE